MFGEPQVREYGFLKKRKKLSMTRIEKAKDRDAQSEIVVVGRLC